MLTEFTKPPSEAWKNDKLIEMIENGVVPMMTGQFYGKQLRLKTNG